MLNCEVIQANTRYGFAPFSMWFPICKGSLTTDEGDTTRHAFEGPLTHPERDIQGDCLRVVRKGLEYHAAIGGPVDWEHGYEKYLDADALIGEATRTWLAPHEADGSEVLHMRTEMFDPTIKPVVLKAVNHFRAGGKLGYSVAGGGVRQSDTGQIVPVVTTVAMTIKPVQAKNAGCLRMVKALAELERVGEDRLRPGMLPCVPETWGLVGPLMFQQFGPLMKSLDADFGLPHEGPGVDALAVEDLAGDDERERKRRKKRRKLEEFGELAEFSEKLEKAVRLHVGTELAERLALA